MLGVDGLKERFNVENKHAHSPGRHLKLSYADFRHDLIFFICVIFFNTRINSVTRTPLTLLLICENNNNSSSNN